MYSKKTPPRRDLLLPHMIPVSPAFCNPNISEQFDAFQQNSPPSKASASAPPTISNHHQAKRQRATHISLPATSGEHPDRSALDPGIWLPLSSRGSLEEPSPHPRALLSGRSPRISANTRSPHFPHQNAKQPQAQNTCGCPLYHQHFRAITYFPSCANRVFTCSIISVYF